MHVVHNPDGSISYVKDGALAESEKPPLKYCPGCGYMYRGEKVPPHRCEPDPGFS